MKIIEVGNTYYRRGAEPALNQYSVRVEGIEYVIVAASARGAEMQAEKRHEEEQGYMAGRGPLCDGSARLI